MRRPHATDNPTDVEFDAFFIGSPGDEKDKLANNIVERFCGMIVHSGTLLATSQRDITVRLPRIYLSACKNALKRVGITIEGEADGA